MLVFLLKKVIDTLSALCALCVHREGQQHKPTMKMTKKEIIKTIKKHSTPEMWSRIIDLHETSIKEEWDEPYSIKDSFDHIDDQSDEHGHKHLQTPCRKVNIALGVYVPMTQEQIDNTVVSHGKKWDFKLGGVAYRFSHHVNS